MTAVLIRVDTPYADTTAGDLCFALDLPEQPALYVLDLPVAGLRLRLLGASHQVVLDGGLGAGGPAADGLGVGGLIETVACLPGRPPSLPATVRNGGYRFTAEVRALAPAALSEAAGDLRDRLDGDPYALVGVFPGDPDAITALRAEHRPGATRWSTWHAYPQTGELVITRTEVIG